MHGREPNARTLSRLLFARGRLGERRGGLNAELDVSELLFRNSDQRAALRYRQAHQVGRNIDLDEP